MIQGPSRLPSTCMYLDVGVRKSLAMEALVRQYDIYTY